MSSGGSLARRPGLARQFLEENGSWRDVHGAGSQRSDPKSGDPKAYPTGHGPQGDAIHIYNHLRLRQGLRLSQPPRYDAALRPGRLRALT